jgi:hypothetical protein
MPALWNSLYLRSENAAQVAENVRASLVLLGYTPFNPFGLIPGKAYPISVRLFVAPAENGWVRIIGVVDDALLGLITQSTFGLRIHLQDHMEATTAQDGQLVELLPSLLPFLKADKTETDLHDALYSPMLVTSSTSNKEGLPLDALPDDVRSMAGGVNPKQAQSLFTRLTGDVLKKVSPSGEQLDAARKLVQQPSQVDWNSPGAVRVQAMMACLTVPLNWRDPDFDTLSDAYGLHERKRLNPNARDYPGDVETMAKVPQALTFTPVYGGKA